MFDHITITASDYGKSRAFYEVTLASLNMKSLYEEKDIVTGFGVDRPIFWISKHDAEHPVSTNVHIAFRCESRELVDAFYQAAMAAGAKDNGAPGLRPQSHENYYAAFVLDPDGNNVEAVYGNS
jgi:catechol 2,3-dioxygenase-like lactoylglutathione lyase family enzyme